MDSHTSKYAISCFTIAFQATNRSIRMSDGRKSWGEVFFLIRDWERETEDLRLALETEVALDIDPASWFILGGSR